MKVLVRTIFLLSLIILAGSRSGQAQIINPQTVGAGSLQKFNGSSTNGTTTTYDSQGRPIKKATGKDSSLQHRDKYADSITIYYRYYDSTRNRTIDSSINDFTTRFPQKYWYNTLGNYGTAANSLLFNPLMTPGWDAGFHQYDMYRFTIENTRFYQTTRPYTELAYLLGNKSEQFINAIHTQNHGSNFNFSLEYRFSNGPGLYKTQNASHNNIRFTIHSQSVNKRYEAFLVLISNKAASSENGGLRNIKQLDSLALGDPFETDTRLGNPTAYYQNPFNTSVNTGNTYTDNTVLFRHQYDFGKKDSLVTDSVTYKLFYARFRLQHTLQISGNTYQFKDNSAVDSIYLQYFSKVIPPNANAFDTVTYKDKWSIITNEFSVISFPDKNNQAQFAKAGIAIQTLTGTFGDTGVYTHHSYYNAYATGEYRNRARNNVWDIEATGKLYLAGLNAGDYSAYISLRRQLSKKIGYLQLGFQNVNKTPAFIYQPETNFPVLPHSSFNKENIVKLFAAYDNPRQSFRLSGEYFLVNNYTYFDSFFRAKQATSLFNVLHVSAEKKFRLAKHINWYTEIHLQQTTGDAPLHVPFLLTRNRLAFEGNFYTNLFMSTGIEARYYSNYKADNYSPFTGQFFYQSEYTTANRPDVNLFFNFRIKSFKAFIRLENINALSSVQSFSFTHYNYALQQYPMQGMWFRLGIWWNFVN